MKENEAQNITIIDKKINVIIGLLSKIANGGEQTTIDRIVELGTYGLTNAEIGNILGKETEYVRKALYQLKNAKKKK